MGRHKIKPGAEWPREWHWFTPLGIEPPFPWLGVAFGFLAGPVVLLLTAWGVLSLVDCELGT